MGKVISLTDNKVKILKPRDKEYKVADGDWLYIKIKPSGLKSWELRYNLNGKQSSKSLGRYPVVTLKEARIKRDEYQKMIAEGIKPRDAEKKKIIMTFEVLMGEYHKHRDDLSEKYLADNTNLLNRDFKNILNMPIADIKPFHLIQCFKGMENRGLKSAPKKAGSLIDRLFKYACTMLYMESNPMSAIDLRILLKKHTPKNFPHITDPQLFKELLCTIDDAILDINTKTALQLMPYAFVRPANIRSMLWNEVDFDRRIWTIPASKMKMNKDHIVPLTDSMISILKIMEGNGSIYVFPSPQSRGRQLSENTLNVALKRMGFAGIMTSHGFRHTASTILHENIHIHGIPSDVIEMQLAHVEKNSVKGIYNKALYMEERTSLMQWWSNYLDGLQENCVKGQ